MGEEVVSIEVSHENRYSWIQGVRRDAVDGPDLAETAEEKQEKVDELRECIRDRYGCRLEECGD